LNPKRRSVLGLSAAAGIGLFVPAARSSDGSRDVSAEMGRLAAYMSAAGDTALQDEVIEHVKHHVVDTLAAIVSGSELGPGQSAIRYARARSFAGSATIIASALTASPADAAMANGMMAHADETDDSHGPSRSHPGSSVVPAALAAGEEFQIDGPRLLRAVALGYDVGTRVAMAMGGPGYSYESHKSTHAITGVFGAAAATACAGGLDARQMRWVLDYTAQQSAGFAAWQRDKDHIEKAFVFAGMPARNGVTAALLVQGGWTGVDDVFSGDDNYFLAYAPDTNVAKLVEQLGERYEVNETDIKRWSVGSPIQGPLDAVEAIRKRRPFEAEEVRKVTVRLAPSVASIVDNRDIPDICLQHMIAVMLLDRTVSFKAAHDAARMKDAEVLRQRAKVELVHDGALQKLLPVRVAVVEVTFANGSLERERVEAVRGTTRNPMSRAEVIAKSRDLMAPVLGDAKSTRLIETIYGLEAVKDVRSLRPLLRGG
jgi:2-methylcitrate dehydratase PrpD